MDKNELKQKYKMPEVLQRYGIEQSRYKRISCPMHNGKDKNCQVSDEIIHCHVCNSSLDIFGLCALMNNITSAPFNEVVEQFCNDMGETYQTKRTNSPRRDREAEKRIRIAQWICRHEQLRIARYRKEIYRPKDLDGEIDQRWAEACKWDRYLSDWLNLNFEIGWELRQCKPK